MKIVPKFELGDLVVIGSYPREMPLKGNPDLVPPIMVVIGIDIESSKKKTFDNQLGFQIAERVKYEVLWFDSKSSVFVSKIVYESFLNLKSIGNEQVAGYMYGGVVEFKPSILEKEKKKVTTSKVINEEVGEKDVYQQTVYSLLSFVCPDLIMTGIRKNDELSTFNDQGMKKSIKPELLVKVLWYNVSQQKYSEHEVPLEVLINIKDTNLGDEIVND